MRNMMFPRIPDRGETVPVAIWEAQHRVTHALMVCVLYKGRQTIEYTWEPSVARWLNEFRTHWGNYRKRLPPIAVYRENCALRDIELQQPVAMSRVDLKQFDTGGWLSPPVLSSDDRDLLNMRRCAVPSPMSRPGIPVVSVWEGSHLGRKPRKRVPTANVLWADGTAVEYAADGSWASFLIVTPDEAGLLTGPQLVAMYAEDRSFCDGQLDRPVSPATLMSETADGFWTPPHLVRSQLVSI